MSCGTTYHTKPPAKPLVGKFHRIAAHPASGEPVFKHAPGATEAVLARLALHLEVAVALTLSPKAFLMDEPMAGLGAGGSKRLTEFLDGLRAQAPILLVEHDMDAVFALADRISVLVYGRIIATGSVAEIRATAAASVSVSSPVDNAQAP